MFKSWKCSGVKYIFHLPMTCLDLYMVIPLTAEASHHLHSRQEATVCVCVCVCVCVLIWSKSAPTRHYTYISPAHQVPLTVSFTAGSQAHTRRWTPAEPPLLCRGGTPAACNDLAGLQLQHLDPGPVALSGEPSESWAARLGSGTVPGAGL